MSVQDILRPGPFPGSVTTPVDHETLSAFLPLGAGEREVGGVERGAPELTAGAPTTLAWKTRSFRPATSGYMNPMDFDQYTIALLMLRDDAPILDEAAEAALQDAHMAHLADLHDQRSLLVAGPVLGPPERSLRGFSIFAADPDEARRLAEADPAVRQGRYRIETFPWIFPAGLVAFHPGRLPRSMTEAGA